MNVKQVRDEYQRTGMLRQTGQLADPSILTELIRDYDVFCQAFKGLRKAGLNYCVPYICTEAIKRAARDPNILSTIYAILGDQQPLVMWGSNIRGGIPNAAHYWHVDTESWNWPSVTVVLGLLGCSPENATCYIAGSQGFTRKPTQKIPYDQVPPGTEGMLIDTFDGFGNGRFFAFDARGWHCGNPDVGGQRLLLFLHFQRGGDPRVPQMRDWREGTWFDRPASYMVIPDEMSTEICTDLYPTPPRKSRGCTSPWSRLSWARLKNWLRGRVGSL